MTRTIEALWNGELAFCEHCGAHDSEANRLIGETAKIGMRFWLSCPRSSRCCCKAMWIRRNATPCA